MRVTRSVVPNLFTLANLFCGFAAIVAAFQNDVVQASILIVCSGVFDMLDGVVARLTESTSEFGIELDSLCDAVSFGVAPSALLYTQFFQSWGSWGLLASSLPALCGVLRLARFNVQLTSTEDKQYFRGMPIPAGAFVIVSFVYSTTAPYPFTWLPTPQTLTVLALSVTVVTALAMVSTIKYDNVPRPTLRSIRQRPVFFVLFLSSIVASVIAPKVVVFPLMMLYIVAGAIRHAIVAQKNNHDEPDDSIEEADPDPFSM
jgi:CDP-diacylglycerol---serine O-phosphatidyltransferase